MWSKVTTILRGPFGSRSSVRETGKPTRQLTKAEEKIIDDAFGEMDKAFAAMDRAFSRLR